LDWVRPDSARLFNATGAPYESYSWTSHAATTYGRCPNGTGDFVATTSSTKGAANDCGNPIKINEVESNNGTPGDWAEIYNPGTSAVNIAGFIFKDNDDTHLYAIPPSTTIAAGGYYVLEEAAFGFGLGAADSARLFDPNMALLDSYTWTEHATTTYGRCPNSSGAFTTTTTSTKGLANACPGDLSFNA
jgi:Lamin Tail Domain